MAQSIEALLAGHMKTQEGAALVKELARRELCRRSYVEYLDYVKPTGPDWKRTRLSEFLANKAQEFIETKTGHAFDIMIVQCPPQHGKTETLTASLPSWYLGKFPDRRVILTAYNDDYAEKFLRKNKDKIRLYGKTIFDLPDASIDRAGTYELKGRPGAIIARGLRSGITGNPGDLIIVDDPIKDKMEAYSPTFRAQLWDAWFGSLRTRLSAGAKVIVIATPWHADDLMSRLAEREQHVTLLKLPVEAQENDPLGRAPGAALCPEIGKDKAWLEDFKHAYLNDPEGGPAAWAAMFMCNPRIEGGNIVKKDWFRRYDPRSIEHWGVTLISVDAAFKGKDSNDFVAITVWSKLGSDYYLRHCSNKHLDFPQTLAELRLVKRLYPEAHTILIEDKANGSAIISTIRHEIPGVLGVNPKGGKEARVNAVAGVIESGHVYVPEGLPWVEDYLDQWAGFPAVPHDDMVDSSTQALSHMLFSSGDPLYANQRLTHSEEIAQYEENAFLDGDFMYDIYGTGGSF